MSCLAKWVAQVEALRELTQLTPAEIDGAARCIQCQRPLRKDGTCVLGHAQTAATSAATVPAEMEALRCWLTEVITAGQLVPPSRKRAPLGKNNRLVTQVTGLLAQLDRNDPGTDPQAIFLQLHALMDPLRHATNLPSAYEGEPRYQVVRAAATRLLTARAKCAVARAATDDAALMQAWHDADLAYQWAHYAQAWAHDKGRIPLPAEAAQARAVLQCVFPTLDLALQESHWRGLRTLDTSLHLALRLHTGGQLPYVQYSSVEDLGTSGGIWVSPATPSDAQGPPGDFSPEVQRALTAVGLQPEPARCFVSLRSIGRLLQGALTTVHALVDTQRPRRDRLRAGTATALATVEAARAAAIPLWQGAIRLKREHTGLLEHLGTAGQDLLHELTQMQEEAGSFLLGIKPALLGQALAGLGYERRVLDLLRFPGVREALLDPASQIDVFQHLPQLGAATVAAKRACDLLQTDATKTVLHPPNVRTMPTLLHARELFGHARSLLPDEDGSGGYWGKVSQMVAGLARSTPGSGPQAAALRMTESRNHLHRLWDTLGSPNLYSLEQARDLATQARMPFARQADRPHITEWLRAETPAEVRRATRQFFRDLVRLGRQDGLTAVDNTGRPGTYRAGQTVTVVTGPASQVGTVRYSFFQAENPDSDGCCDVVHPMMHVQLADGTEADVPFADIRRARPKRGT